MIDLALSIAASAREAGAGIMDIYDSGHMRVETKADDSPLTAADLFSHELIMRSLEELTPEIPVISEEGEIPEYGLRKAWKTFYLVDPLDGTRSFIKKSGEFTVNVALMEDGVPVLGVIYAPASDILYYASRGDGAFVKRGNGKPVRINVAHPRDIKELVLVMSRSHAANERDFFDGMGIVHEYITSGSSMKFCLVADGSAYLYPRFGPIHEWDTAAGHAILIESGGRVIDLRGFKELEYNKRKMLHHGFLALPNWMLEGMIPYLEKIPAGEV